MPKRKDETDNSENIRVRISHETRERCNSLRLAGAHKREAESSFLGYLLELGLVRYEKIIFPIENSDDEIGTNQIVIPKANARLYQSESRFFELLPYFPESIRKKVIDENLNWEQVKQRFGPILLTLFDRAEKEEKTKKEANPIHDKDRG